MGFAVRISSTRRLSLQRRGLGVRPSRPAAPRPRQGTARRAIGGRAQARSPHGIGCNFGRQTAEHRAAPELRLYSGRPFAPSGIQIRDLAGRRLSAAHVVSSDLDWDVLAAVVSRNRIANAEQTELIVDQVHAEPDFSLARAILGQSAERFTVAQTRHGVDGSDHAALAALDPAK